MYSRRVERREGEGSEHHKAVRGGNVKRVDEAGVRSARVTKLDLVAAARDKDCVGDDGEAGGTRIAAPRWVPPPVPARTTPPQRVVVSNEPAYGPLIHPNGWPESGLRFDHNSSRVTPSSFVSSGFRNR